MDLTQIEFVNGLLSTILVCISAFVGLRIAAKYRSNKDRTFLFFGITWIVLVEPWYPSMLSFLMITFGGKGLSLFWYLFIGIAFIPIGIFTGLTAFTELLYKKKQKLIQILIMITGVIFEIVFLTCLLIDPKLMGELYGPVDIDFSLIVKIFLLANGPICVIAGALFARESIRSDNPEIKLRGKLLVVAFLVFGSGALIEVIVFYEIYTLIARIFVMIGTFFFYIGFISPKWLKRWSSK